jgi:hypothetical protein
MGNYASCLCRNRRPWRIIALGVGIPAGVLVRPFNQVKSPVHQLHESRSPWFWQPDHALRYVGQQCRHVGVYVQVLWPWLHIAIANQPAAPFAGVRRGRRLNINHCVRDSVCDSVLWHGSSRFAQKFAQRQRAGGCHGRAGRKEVRCHGLPSVALRSAISTTSWRISIICPRRSLGSILARRTRSSVAGSASCLARRKRSSVAGFASCLAIA